MPKQAHTHTWKKNFSTKIESAEVRLAKKRLAARKYCEPTTQELLAEIRGDKDYPRTKKRKDYTIIGPQTAEEWLNG
jgi:hypothetical protein